MVVFKGEGDFCLAAIKTNGEEDRIWMGGSCTLNGSDVDAEAGSRTLNGRMGVNSGCGPRGPKPLGGRGKAGWY